MVGERQCNLGHSFCFTCNGQPDPKFAIEDHLFCICAGFKEKKYNYIQEKNFMGSFIAKYLIGDAVPSKYEDLEAGKPLDKALPFRWSYPRG